LYFFIKNSGKVVVCLEY